MGNACRGSPAGKKFQGSVLLGDQNTNSFSDQPPPSINSQPPTTQELTKETPVMKRALDYQTYCVLGHKTPDIRDIYIIGRKLGQGQYGTTFLCSEIGTGLEYACKSISKRKLIVIENFEDVMREIQIMHHLAGHKNIVSINGAYEDHLYVHITMELCAGGELFDRIIQRGQYSERKDAELTKIIVGGLWRFAIHSE